MASKKQVNNENWLLNKSNILFALISVVLIGGLVYLQTNTNSIRKNDNKVASELSNWQSKLDKLIARNNQVIYLPKPGDIQLSKGQSESIKWLNSFFSRATTYNNNTGYNTIYNYAKQSVHDEQFYKGFMASPKYINALQLKSKNIRTQIIVTGPTSYQAIVTYVPYHNDSDLYQESQLQTMTTIFNIQGIAGNYQHFSIDNSIDTSGTRINASDID